MDSKEHLATSCDTLNTTAPEAQWYLHMSAPTLKQETVEYIDEEESACSDNMYQSEPLEPSEFVNYYESKEYVLKQLKKEFPEDECLETHDEDEQNVNNMYQGTIKMERLEEQDILHNAEATSIHYHVPVTPQVVQSKLCDRIFKNSFNLLKHQNEHIKVEINTSGDNDMIELHQCQYYDKVLKNSDNMLSHVDDVHSNEKPKDKLYGKQLPSTLHPDASELNKPVNEGKTKISAKRSDDELILRRKRQNADRVRAYRERKKALGFQSSSQAELHSEPQEKNSRLSTDVMPSSGPASSVGCNTVSEKILRQKRLNAERCRRYRQKCKRLKSGGQNSSNHNQDFSNDESSLHAPKHTSVDTNDANSSTLARVYSRRYREKLNARRNTSRRSVIHLYVV